MMVEGNSQAKIRLWGRIIRPIQRKLRRKRAERILQAFPEIVGARVVDIGGSIAFWRGVSDILRPRQVIIYNIDMGRATMALSDESGIEIRIYDGTRIPEEDASADIVICNSVIEHVPVAARGGFAAELRRIAKRFVVQTPSPVFPIELHFGLPLVHWLPRPLGRILVRLSPFGLLTDANAAEYFDQTQLLGKAELRQFFPGASIQTESLLGMPKSYLVISPA
jgi:Methyltransferase domain